MKYPFEATEAELHQNMDEYITSVFSLLQSEFMTLPKGEGFIDYPTFERGYEALKQATTSFGNVTVDTVLPVVLREPISLIVIRTMLGFTPPEWAYVTTQRTGIQVPQGAARSIDRRIRLAPEKPLTRGGVTAERITALVTTACQLLSEGMPAVEPDRIHRLDKADTRSGIEGVKSLASIGVPYAMLLYERFLGRPFSGHRDSISELVGDELELIIENQMHEAGIGYRKTKRAERVQGFDQAPDFIIPDEFNPQVVIEAKITEDDGTARDKVTRVQHLHSLSIAGGDSPGVQRFEVIACIGGRGFGVRRADMKKLLIATNGKVFTRPTMHFLIERTRLREFAAR